MSGYVNVAPGFYYPRAVVDGFSRLVVDLWGPAGRHARSAVGVAELTFDIPVEIEAVVRLS